MSLEDKSRELKELVSTFETAWFLGDLSGLMRMITMGVAQDQLGRLSSPLRQLYFLGGLNVTSGNDGVMNVQDHETWNKIVDLLNEIEQHYLQMFFPEEDEEIDEEWKRVRKVAMPSFLSYFNQGPLNYEEQSINWVTDLYTLLDSIIEPELGIKTQHFVEFYNNLDNLVQSNFSAFSKEGGTPRDNWQEFAKVEMGLRDDIPEMMQGMMQEMFEMRAPLMHFMADKGIISRFYPEDLVSDNLTLDEVNNILTVVSCRKEEQDFIYYTAMSPGNPLYETPIIQVDDGMYQVFEVKQVIHAIDKLLEKTCSSTVENTTKLIDKKGKLLEARIVDLFNKLTNGEAEIITSYYVDGCEQDILVLWENHAYIIEAKGYKVKEPFRDPNRAFNRIKNDFKSCIGYGFDQTTRVSEKFMNQVPLNIEDKNGAVVQVIDTTKYEDNDYSIIVNLESFGQIQNDLSTLLEQGDHAYPWAVKLDDLEVIILMILAHKKSAYILSEYLILRESLHGRLICSDELEVFGAFLTGDISDKHIESDEVLVTSPDLVAVFDEQYKRGMGFENEKMLDQKQSGKTLFWG